MTPCTCAPPRPGVQHIHCSCWHHDDATRGALKMQQDENATWWLPKVRSFATDPATIYRLFSDGLVDREAFRTTMGF